MLVTFITVAAWLALIMTVSGLVLMVFKLPTSDRPKQLAGQVIGAVAGIFLEVGLLVRENLAVYAPLVLIAIVLVAISLTVTTRNRGA